MSEARESSPRHRTALWAMVLLVIAVACGDGGGSTTSQASTGEFELATQPSRFMPVIPGQMALAVVSPAAVSGLVTMSARLTGSGTVEPTTVEIHPGEVAEFLVVPAEDAVGTTLRLDIVAETEGERADTGWSMEVVEWEDTIRPLATELRDRFVSHISANYPDLGIDADTVWTPSITKPQILVVMHYLFFSDEWEMGINWHVTVPEHAWSRMYLRPRTGLLPTFGLEIPSYLDPESKPRPWEPPAELDR